VEKFQAVLLDVWREACRHIEIRESTKRILRLLKRQMNVEQILVRRYDSKRGFLETVAAETTGGDGRLGEARTECSTTQKKRFLQWCRREEVLRCRHPRATDAKLDFLLPKGLESEALAGPLGSPEDPLGVLILVARAGRAFTQRHVALAGVLLDPFSVALGNDHQLREVAALREAAEADKRSLLAKLGRKHLGDTIVGAEHGLKTVMERVELVGRSDVPVLIFGETGTGKELIARAIHNRSPRGSGPFHRVNCGAIPAELIDSQLFGHEKGAFTGAVEQRKGWFERADAGTLFLDEIGELPPAAQVRLLRILQDGWLERVGGQEPVSVDVRIVAATHRDLESMIAEGRFREDLWYRLAVFPIRLPPLRNRQEDIPEMARHFAHRAATRFGLPETMPTQDDIGLLSAYAWPGNVRELGAVIDRAALLGDGRGLEVAKALGFSVDTSVSPSQSAPTVPPAPSSSAKLVSLETAIRHHIEAALAATQGRIEGPHGAAVLLDINPHTLRARMRKLGIEWTRFRS